MPKFKVGDIVRINPDVVVNPLGGMMGDIIKVFPLTYPLPDHLNSQEYEVHFNDVRFTVYNTLWFSEEELELVE